MSRVGIQRVLLHAGHHATAVHTAASQQQWKGDGPKQTSPIGLQASSNLHYPTKASLSAAAHATNPVAATKVPKHLDRRRNQSVHLQGGDQVSLNTQYTSKPSEDVRASCQLGSRIPKPVVGRTSINGPFLITRSPRAPQQQHKSNALDSRKQTNMPEGQHRAYGHKICPTKKSSIADSSCSAITSAELSSDALPHACSHTEASPGLSGPAAHSFSASQYITPSKLPSPSVALPKDTPPRKAPTLRFTPPKGASGSPTPGGCSAGGLSALETHPIADAQASPSSKPQVKSDQGPSCSPSSSAYETLGPVKSKDPWNSYTTVGGSKNSPGGSPVARHGSHQQHASPTRRDTRTPSQRAAASEKALLGNLSRLSHSDDRELHPKLRAKACPVVPTTGPATMPQGPAGETPTLLTPSFDALSAEAGEQAYAVACHPAANGELDFAKVAPGQLPADLLGIRERKAVAPAESPLSLSMVQRSLPRVRTREAVVPEKTTKCTSCVIM